MPLTVCVNTISLKSVLEEHNHCYILLLLCMPNQVLYFLAMMLSHHRQPCNKVTPSALSCSYMSSMTSQGQPFHLFVVMLGTLTMKPLVVSNSSVRNVLVHIIAALSRGDLVIIPSKPYIVNITFNSFDDTALD